MLFAAAPFDAHTIGLMTAALEAAWVAARLSVPGLSHDGRAKMECAILIKVAAGERDYKQLQQAAFDAVFDVVGAIAKPVERRQQAPGAPPQLDEIRKLATDAIIVTEDEPLLRPVGQAPSPPHHVDEQYFAMLAAGAAELSAEEADELAQVFGENGELRVERLS